MADVSLVIDRLRAQEAGLPLGASNPDPPLHCFPLRIDWEMSPGYQASVDPYPIPAAAGHLVTAEHWPAPVRDLVGLAQRFGWSAQVTRAVGTMPHATHGTPTSEAESFAVRLVRGSQRTVAVRRGSWDSFWTWSPSKFFTRAGTLEELLAEITGSMCAWPRRSEWDALLVKYPKRPSQAQWAVMRAMQDALSCQLICGDN